MYDAYITFLAILLLIAVGLMWAIGKTKNDGTISLNIPTYILAFIMLALLFGPKN